MSDEVDFDDDMPMSPEEAKDKLDQPEWNATSDKMEMVEPETIEFDGSNLKPQDAFDSIPDTFRPRNTEEEMLLARKKCQEVATLIRLQSLPDSIITMLKDAIDTSYEEDFDMNFDVREELKTQLKLLRNIRSHITNNDTGLIKESVSVSEMKSVIDAGMKLSDMLNKVNKDLVNMERIQAIEAAFLETSESFPDEQKKEFLELLEKRFKAQEQLRKQI